MNPDFHSFGFVADFSIAKSFEVVKADKEPNVTSEVDEGRWVIEGLASTSDIDSQDHVITSEALVQGAASLQKYQTVLFNHEPDHPIGFVEKAEARDGKLFVKAIISKSEEQIWKKIKDGTLSKFSIFGRVNDAEEEEVDGKSIVMIKSLDIFEVSVVSVPANAEAKSLAWYVEKAFNASKDGTTFPLPFPPGLIHQTVEETRPVEAPATIEKEEITPDDTSSEDGGNIFMTKLEQAISELKSALEAASTPEEREQIGANIRSLEALSKGGSEDKQASLGEDTVTPEVKDETTKIQKDADPAALLDNLRTSLNHLSSAVPSLSEEEQAMGKQVVQWMEQLVSSIAEEAPEGTAGAKTAAKSIQLDMKEALGFAEVIAEMKTIARTNQASLTANVALAEKMMSVKAEIDEQFSGLVEALKGTSLRKGLAPDEVTGQERQNEDENVLGASHEKELESVRSKVKNFDNKTPADRLRLILRERTGHDLAA